jgi:anti-sigma B factor antagonist
MKGLDIQLKVIDADTIILEITGDMNIYNANELRKEFDRHVISVAHLFILNIGKMTMIDSAGIGVLFTILNRVRNLSGQVKIVQARENVKKLFEITKVTKFFTLLDTEEEALGGAAAAQPR